MKFLKPLAVLVLCSSIFTACKDTASKPTATVEQPAATKEIAAATNPQTATFHIDGMTCAMGCAKTIEEKLSGMQGVQNAKVDFETKTATVDFDLDKLQKSDLTKAVESCADGKTYKVSGVDYAPKS